MMLRVAFLGMSHGFSAGPVRAIRRKQRLVGVVESGRRGAEGETLLEGFARRRGVGYVKRREELAGFLREVRADLLVVAGSGWLLTAEEFGVPRLGAINVHPSLLPRYRGPQPLFWQYRAGDLAGGVTVHAIDGGIDAGDILGQREVAIGWGESQGSVLARAGAAGADLLAEVLEDIEAGLAVRRRQAGEEAGTFARWPKGEDLRPDYERWDLRQVWHFLRGMQGAFGILPAEAGTWWEIGRMEAAVRGAAAGAIGRDGRGFFVGHREGVIRLRRREAPRGWKETVARWRQRLEELSLWS